MQDFLRKLWRIEGTVGRAGYVSAGIIAFAIKFIIDWSIAHAFGGRWRLLNYWHLAGANVTIPETVALLTAALPFIWFGVTMSLLRGRDAGVPPIAVTLFFLPILNLLYFAALSVLPPRPVAQTERAHRTESTIESAIYAVLVTTIIALPCIALSTFLFRVYGVMLFVGLPFCIGFIAAIIHGWRAPRTQASSLLVALTALLFVGGALMAVAWEGAVCLLMAAPLAITLTVLGAVVGHVVQARPAARAAMCLPLLLPIAVSIAPQPRLRVVRSSIDIDAPPERVWRNVIEFSEITEPPELMFRAGIAYPLGATIAGRTRYCIFTTGAFVEPIVIRDPPRRLAFDVTQNPPPMRELSPYDIRPPHLEGYFVSTRGEFLLEPLPGGRTRLSGLTWYRQALAPAAYWQLWSDAIIHRIHMRVLRHIASASSVRLANS